MTSMVMVLQVVSGVLVTTDLTLTNGADSVHLVATQYLSSVASSMLSMATVAGTRSSLHPFLQRSTLVIIMTHSVSQNQ
jgi:hypothetical protein